MRKTMAKFINSAQINEVEHKRKNFEYTFSFSQTYVRIDTDNDDEALTHLSICHSPNTSNVPTNQKKNKQTNK